MASDTELSATPMPMPIPPGLARRLAAIAYDSLLLTAVLIVATAILLPFTGGEAIHPGSGWYATYLFIVSFAYFGWFWTHGGQTLGMRSWRLRLVGDGSNGATWGQALVRFAAAAVSWLVFGVGFLWMLVDYERLTWHDRISATRLVGLS